MFSAVVTLSENQNGLKRNLGRWGNSPKKEKTDGKGKERENEREKYKKNPPSLAD